MSKQGIYVGEDETYPYFVMVNEGDGECDVDIPEEKIEWINRVIEESGQVQDYLEELYNKVEKRV